MARGGKGQFQGGVDYGVAKPQTNKHLRTNMPPAALPNVRTGRYLELCTSNAHVFADAVDQP